MAPKWAASSGTIELWPVILHPFGLVEALSLSERGKEGQSFDELSLPHCRGPSRD
jgi:hypothetical protein